MNASVAEFSGRSCLLTNGNNEAHSETQTTFLCSLWDCACAQSGPTGAGPGVHRILLTISCIASLHSVASPCISAKRKLQTGQPDI